MHNTVRRWSARRSYVVLAFILIIIVLVLAGCRSVNRVQEETGPLTAERVADVPGAVVDADSGSTTRRAIIGRHADQRVEVAIFASPSYRNEPIRQRYTR